MKKKHWMPMVMKVSIFFRLSELQNWGGKVMAEGTNIEADLLTLSTFYIDSTQEEKQMFQDLTLITPYWTARLRRLTVPITSQRGTMILILRSWRKIIWLYLLA